MERDRAVDWARGVAVLAMIETHALQGWASETAKQTTAYGWTRVVATSPLPAFMLLAGMALRLRIGAAEARREAPATVRAAILRRGFEVVLWGYGASATYALMDGHDGLRTFLRADVLHVIGLSIMAMAWLGLAPGARVDAGSATRRAWVLALTVTLLSPLYYSVAPTPEGPIRYLLALFVRVPGVTLFPLLPMIGWAAFGFAAADAIGRVQARRGQTVAYAGAAAVGLGVALTGDAITRLWLGPGGVVDYVHPAGIPNMIGYAGRGLFLIGLGPLLVAALPERVRGWMTQLGQASLIAYVFHIPFCYGALAAPLKGQLGVAEAIPFVLLLCVASYAVVALSRAQPIRFALPGPAR